jgi:hypothetical protein
MTTTRRLTNAQRRGRQQWQKQRQCKGRQQSTKKWQQRCSKWYLNCNILNITRLLRMEQGAAVCGRSDRGNGVGSQQRQAQGQATVAKAEAVQGHTTIPRMTAAAMIDRCEKSHRAENLSSCSYSAFCLYPPDMHHAAMMYQIGRRKEATNSAWRLLKRQLGSRPPWSVGECLLANLPSKNTCHNRGSAIKISQIIFCSKCHF